MSLNPYITDILSQPTALRDSLEHYPSEQIELLRACLLRGDFSRIVLTGMGSSLYAAYPAWLNLLALPVPVIHANTAEVLHYGQPLIDSRTLLWINSQSGRSVEIVRLLEALKDHRPAFQLSMSNYLDSPMSQSADLAVPIYAGNESTVSTKTYINMLAMLLLVSTQLTGGNCSSLRQSMSNAADAIEAFLANWQDKVSELDSLLGEVDQLLIVGRGPSMGAVWNGSLVIKEASKCMVEGMNAADFRHGPLELTSLHLTLLVMEGTARTSRLNYDLAMDVAKLGGKVIWLGPKPAADFKTFTLPVVDEAVLPLVEILPAQMLSILLAQRKGLEPGVFRNIGKVTEVE